jgi:formamidopyrimidine-DNA glycosylase
VPELPEVETVVRDLRPLLVGRRIQAVARPTGHHLRTPWSPDWDSVRDLRPLLTGRRLACVRRASDLELRRPWDVARAERVAGRAVAGVRRRGKWIILDLDDQSALVAHLGMTGQLTVVPAAQELAAHTHLVFDLAPGDEQLRFRDPRRFGSVTWHAGPEALEALFKGSGLGPEPFELAPAAWRASLAGTDRAIKAVLLDQTVVAGVGNIYADEALFRARLHPARRGRDLGRAEADRLRKAVAEVLTRAIDKRGSTIRDYVGGSGLAGGYQDELSVYGRKGEPCPRCGAAVAVVRLGGRSSHYCPRCQPAPSAPS